MEILHTSIAVKDMEESIRFYCDTLGLNLLRRRERPKSATEKNPESTREIAFLGDGVHEIELTCWTEQQNWITGNALDHIALAVPDLNHLLQRVKKQQVEIVREPFTREGSTRRVAFIKDPNGIWLEVFER
jgi:lactoylglutathione lyase